MPAARSLAVAVTAVALVGTVGVGFAATTGVASTALAGGAAAVGRCDVDGVSVSGITAGSTVAALDIVGLDPDCEGGLLRVVVVDGDGGVLAAGSTAVTAARPVAVTLDQAVPKQSVVASHVVVEGP